ncbi:ABC transporter substrate-binding protein [Streptomyces sp. VRA16 Mangrove soil]|uniref:peptide ABC transporter substrate-binding protein n=1 Tax=Streptomyces sp. VRA16 Mangrove soil TaxID=2817434 RepID=UPI001A9E2295|nr:ABC transporter substrate-binding protein [Streptomyces sp. VRA16 Mangrove soil]MBO1329772.1 ABC transporter substrate-binding protein [Streptomyces sp. VRA16 Mangrove soil]
MARTRRIATAATGTAVAVVLAGCSGSGGDDGAGKDGVRSLTIATAAEIPLLNPSNDNGTTGIQIESALWAPLTRVDAKTGKLVNVVAESVTSQDAKTWTIKIKPGWTFTNGEKLTAKSFVDTWNYTALGEHGFANNGAFQRVKGYEDLNPAKGKPKATTLSGLKVVDDLTFTVTLKAPFSPYPTTLSYLGVSALSAETLKNPDRYKHNPIGYGAYKLDGEWKAGQPVRLTRNKDYQGKDAPEADRITFRFFSNPETAYNEFLAGNVDYAAVPSSKIDAYKTDAPGKWSQAKAAGNLSYLNLPVTLKPYGDTRIRRALSLALDRESLAKLKPGNFPATSFTAPSIEGHRENTCTACTQDVAEAKKLLSEAGGFPGKLRLFFASDNPGEQVYAEALGNMWRQKLGLKIQYVGKPGAEIGPLANEGKLDGIRIMGWGHDYPSLEDYLTPLFASYGDVNTGRYKDAKVDSMLASANAEVDQAKATKDYQAIEDRIDRQMPVVPLAHSRDVYLHADGVEPLNTRYTSVDPVRSTFGE